MPKIRTRRSAAKRLKVTGTGKLVARHAYRSHLLTRKGTKRKRRLSHDFVLSGADQKQAKRMVPYL